MNMKHSNSAMNTVPARILVVEDDTAVRDFCIRTLRINGYQVSSAENGRVAIERLHKEQFDLVLTDLQMPEMGGISLVQELRQCDTDTDVIFFTAYGTVDTAREALRLGAFDYLSKPLSLDELEHSVRRAVEWRHIRQEKQRLSEIVALFEISQTFTSTLDTLTAVREIGQLLQRRFAPQMLSISLLHEEDNQMEALASHGITMSPPFGHRIAIDRCTNEHIEQAHLALFGMENNAAAPSHLIAIVLRTNDRPVGMIHLTRDRDQPGFTEGERKMLAICASQIATSLDNSRLYQQLKDQHLQTVRALSAAIDARDPYTRGHSEQVMRYAVRMAEIRNLAPERIENLRYGALLHDIGKIGIRDDILLKPGFLTEDERLMMEQHPRIGADILRGIKALHNITNMIEYHHERVDGKGYPSGVDGSQLSEEIRILTIADSYDAMTSDRAYRKGMPSEKAFHILLAGRGTHWDSDMVDQFIELIKAEGPELTLAGKPIGQTNFHQPTNASNPMALEPRD